MKRLTLVGVSIAIAAFLWMWLRESEPPPTSVPASSRTNSTSERDDVLAPPPRSARASETPNVESTAPSTGTIVLVHGRCVDPSGLVVDGADVAITSFTWWKSDAEKPSWVDARTGPESPLLARTKSREDGRFTLSVQLDEVLPPRTLVDATVQARTSRQISAHARKGTRDSFELEVGDLVLDPSTRIAGFVRDTAGRPCEGVRLYVYSPTGKNSGGFARSRGDGSFAIENAPIAPCNLDAWDEASRATSLAIDLSDGAPRLDLLLVLPELEGLDSISGIVVDPDGQPIPKAYLRELQTTGPEPRQSMMTTCDDHGRFRIDGKPDSTFDITAADSESRWTPVRKTDIRSGTHGIVIQLDGSRTFLLRVRSATGVPIEKFGYERGEGFLWSFPRPIAATVHLGGEVRLASDVGPFIVKVHAPGWSTREVGRLDPAALPEIVDVVLEPACTVRGVVRSGDNPTRAMVTIDESELTNRRGESRFEAPSADGRTDKEGRFEITVDGEGTLRLQAQARPAVSPLSEPIAVKPGAVIEGIVLELGEGGSIEGRVLRFDGSPAAGVGVTARRGGETLQAAFADANGAYSIVGVDEGHCDVSVEFRGGFRLGERGARTEPQRWSCEVTNGATTKLDLHLLETVRLRLSLDLPQPPGAKWALELSTNPTGAAGSEIHDRTTQGKETFDFEFIDPIDASLELDCALSSWPRLFMKRRTFDRGPHEIPITFRAGRIEGTSARPFAVDQAVTLKWSAGAIDGSVATKLDAQGHFTFECAPEGECRLQRSGGAEQVVQVRGGETTRVDVP